MIMVIIILELTIVRHCSKHFIYMDSPKLPDYSLRWVLS